MATYAEIIKELLQQLKTAQKESSLEKRSAPLYKDDYADALVQLRSADAVAFDQTVKEISKITNLGIKAIRAHVDKRAMELQAAEIPETDEEEPIPLDIEEKARKALEHGDPVKERIDYVKTKIHGVDKQARVNIYSEFSAYMEREYRQHCDSAGSSQAGKTFTTMVVMDTFPEGDSKLFTDVSQKFFYYWADTMGERLEHLYIYIDDVRDEHIPILKAFRNEAEVKPSHGTIIEKEAAELTVKYRPVLNASSVSPLQDLEGQTPSRTFLITYQDVSLEIEKDIRKKIRERKRFGALLKAKGNPQLDILRAQAWILRDEGIKDVLMLFDVEEPENADRRGTGQFMNFIMISSFIYQFQRPILELDGKKYILATYEDFRNAAEIWFDFNQGIKINDKALEVLDCLPENESKALTSNEITEELQRKGAKIRGQSSVEYYLKVLFEKGYVMRKRVAEAGAPYVWWKAISREMSSSEISTSGDISQQYPSNPELGKYLAENSSDSLEKAYEASISISEVNIREEGRIYFRGKVIEGDQEEKIISLLFSPKSTREMKNEPTNTEYFPGKENSGIVGKGIEPSADSGISQVSKNMGNLDEVLVYRRIKKAIAEGITDPIKLSEICCLPVCLASKFPGIKEPNSTIDLLQNDIKIDTAAIEGVRPPVLTEQESKAQEATSRVKKPRLKKAEWSGKVVRFTFGREKEVAPLAADLFEGCDNGCLYCWARRSKSAEDFGKPRRIISLADLESDLQQLQNYELPGPVLLSFECDVYSSLADRVGLTRPALELFKKYGIPKAILTKGGTKAARDFDMYIPGDIYISTLTLSNPEDAKFWEPNSASPEDRLKSMQLAFERGITTWGMFEPCISPDQSLEMMERAKSFSHKFIIGRLNHGDDLWKRGVDPEIVELLENIDWQEYRTRAEKACREWNMPYQLKNDLKRAVKAPLRGGKEGIIVREAEA